MKTIIYIITTTILLFGSVMNTKAERRSMAKRAIILTSPSGFTYQAAIRDDAGNPLANTAVTLRLSLQTAADASGILQWEEVHTVSTNDFGLLNVVVGQGSQTGGNQNDFASIPWATSDMFLKVEIDQGSGFVDLGTNQLYSTPYALNASNGITNEQSQKLSGIGEGAEPNVQADWSVTDNTSDDFILNKPDIPADVSDLTDNNGLLEGGFSGNYNDLTDIPSDLADGDDINDADADATNEIQDLQLSGNTLTITNNVSASSIDLSAYLDNTDTQLSESEVDGFVSNNGYLTSEVDGDATNEIQDLQLSGNTLTITNNGSATSIDLSAYLDNVDTQLTEGEVDGFVSNNGYLTSEVDGDATNEIQDLQLVGNTLTITNNGSATSIDLSAYLDNTDTQLTESEVDGFVSNNGYLTSEVDGDATNEIQDLQLSGNTLTITNNGSATSIDLSAYLDNTDTQLTESEVDGFVSNNGYLTSEVDGDATNEIQDLQLIGNTLTITNNGSATSIDLSAYLDDTDTQIIQDLQFSAGILSITNNSEASNIDFSNYDSNASDDFSGNYNDLTNKPTIPNYSSTGSNSFVAGSVNTASNQNGFVGGGSGNNNSGYGAVIAGGDNNTASAQNATVGGGRSNTASSEWATIAGGDGNVASNLFASVTGGRYNTASGWASTASGRSMYAEAFGEFAIGVYGTRANSPTSGSYNATDRLFTIGNGQNTGALSDALVMLKNGNTDLNGDFVANSLGVDGVFTFPTTDGTTGQVLSTDGSGSVSWATPNYFSGNYVDLTNKPTIPNYSSTGSNSFVAGSANTASNQNGFVGGGSGNNNSGYGAVIAGGDNNAASAQNATVGGGRSNTASSEWATIAGGDGNVASNLFASVTGGRYNTASGWASTASGRSMYAEAFGEFAIGVYGTRANSPTSGSYNATDRLFTIGNGQNTGALSDALVMLKNGNTDLNGDLVANSLGVDGVFTFPTTDGTSGQVLSTDGSGSIGWTNVTTTPTIVTSSASSVAIPDNTKDYILSHSGTATLTVTMPSSSTTGDKINIASSNSGFGSMALVFTGSASIRQLSTGSVTGTLNDSNPNISMIYDGSQWLVLAGSLTFTPE